MAFLNDEGLQHLWDKIVDALKGKASKEHLHGVTDINGVQAAITGTAGQFVVIGTDGKVTTKTIDSAEEASF